MPFKSVLLALCVVVVWGTNFVVIHAGLGDFPPFLFAALRFLLCVFPWIFFVPRPKTDWRMLASYGCLVGPGQFGLLFLAMRHDISPGLASLVVQMQAFFTIALAVLVLGERLEASAIVGIGLALAGLALVAWHALGDAGAQVTPWGLALVLGAAAAWAGANLISRRIGPVNALSFVVWSSLFALPPLLALALFAQTPAEILSAVRHATAVGWLATAWQAIGNTLFGFAAWTWLLARYPAAKVTPTGLLVPVVGVASSAWWLGEPVQPWKLAAVVLVVVGLSANLYGQRLVPMLQRLRSSGS